ncbi:putative ribonuclease H-like domain-containing protein [Tanacetum coccineum]
MVSRNNYTRVNYNYSAKKAHPSAHRNIVPRAVLMKTGLRPLNTARPVNTAHPKTTVYSARPMSCFSKSAQSTVKRPYQMRTTLTNKIFCQKVNTAKGKVNTARPKAVNTARPNTTVVNAVRANQVNAVKTSACWVWRPTKLNSASITFKRHNYVDARGRSKGGAKGGRITGKGTLKTGKLDFKDVYFVKELQFTCIFFLASKDETSGILKSFITQIENLVDKKVKIIRCDNGTKFKNRVISEFCEKKGIKREFSIARTPQQNGVAERRNRTVIKAARTMLVDYKMPTTFWAEAVNTACYVQNQDNHNLTNDARKKDDEGGIDDQERTKNSAQDVNTTRLSINTASTNFNTGSLNINIVSLTVPTAPIESTYADFFGDESEFDLSNIPTRYPVPTTLNTRIHKYHSLDHVFGDCDVWIEAIKLFLAYASFKDFVVYQMDVKSAFLYDKIEKEVYVLYQIDVKSAFLYGKIEEVYDKGFQRGQIDKTLFIKRIKHDILLVQVYVDDVIFISTKKELCTDFKKLMHKKFPMSSIASTPMETSKPLLKDAEADDIDVHLYKSMIGSLMFQSTLKITFYLEAYTDIDYAGASLDRKSTTGGCQFLGRRLISWQCKKQTIVANSTTEAEYVAAASCCGQTKHIEIRHHFIRDSNEKKLIQMIKIHTDHNVADLLTKAFDIGRF